MPRIDPTVSKKAEEIYKSIDQGDRGKFVSDAIVEKHSREQGTDIQTEIQELRKRIEKLEHLLNKEG